MMVSDYGRSDDGRVLSLWRCDCGNTRVHSRSRVRRGSPLACVECGLASGAEKLKTHGMRYTPEYSSWMSMRQRCLNETSKDYPRYGGAGIKICQEWQDSFETFYADMGKRPKGFTLDRIDNTKGYFPGNVRWADSFVQARNRSSSLNWEINGERFDSILDASRRFGVSQHTVSRWVNGEYDARRGTVTLPKASCVAERKYK